MIINAESFSSELSSGPVLFSGNGAEKVKPILQHPNASFSSTRATAEDMSIISDDYFNRKIIADLAYTEPFYLKEFYSGLK